MPLKRQPELPTSVQNQSNQALFLSELSSPDSNLRCNAVEALAANSAMLPVLCRHLATERTPCVVELIATAVLRQPDHICADTLAALITPDDLVLNNLLADILRLYPTELLTMATAGLYDNAINVRAIWLQIVANWPLSDRLPILEPLIGVETEPGLVAAMVELLAESRSAHLRPMFFHVAARFPDNSFVQFTVQQATNQLDS